MSNGIRILFLIPKLIDNNYQSYPNPRKTDRTNPNPIKNQPISIGTKIQYQSTSFFLYPEKNARSGILKPPSIQILWKQFHLLKNYSA